MFYISLWKLNILGENKDILSDPKVKIEPVIIRNTTKILSLIYIKLNSTYEIERNLF